MNSNANKSLISDRAQRPNRIRWFFLLSKRIHWLFLLLNRLSTYSLLLLFSLIFLVPFFWLITTSFKTQTQLYKIPPEWIPNPWTLYSYVNLFVLVPMMGYLKNTVIVTVLGTLGSTLSSAVVGYGFARGRAPGLNWLFGLCLATMMLPAQVTMIPQYIIFSRLHWVDTLLPLWVPAWFASSAYNIFLFRQFFKAIPRDLDEAAMLDGASPLRIFWSIILPNSHAVFAIVAAFAIQYFWTDLFSAVIYLNSPENFTLARGLAGLAGGTRVSYVGEMMAASLMMTVPMLLVYFYAQRYIAEGIATTGRGG